MSRSRVLSLVLSLALALPLFAEKNNRCGTRLPTPEEEAALQAALDLQKGRPTVFVTIPVWFHVISNGPGFENGVVPDKMIRDQVSVLNQTFA